MVCDDNEIEEISRALCTVQHPARSHPPPYAEPYCRADDRVDWSFGLVGKWTQHKAGGEVPLPMHGFSAAHFNGQIYTFGGRRGGSFSVNDELCCLDLASMQWRKVDAKGQAPVLSPSVSQAAAAVWKSSSLCILDRWCAQVV